MAGKWGYRDVVPITAMVAVECSDVVLSILFKAASLKGMSYFVYIAYCYVLATLVFVPLAFLSNRKKLLIPLEFPLISRICLLGLLGFSGQVCAYKGLELGSPTLASAISNLAPAFTFILAVLFRIEKVSFTSSTAQAKIIGTLTSISGALLIVLYKGPKVIPSSTSSSVSLQWPLESTQSNWVIGGLLEALAYLFFSFWYIVQSKVMKIYPEEITVNVYYNMSVAIIALAACLIKEQNLSSWTLHPSISVVSVLYSGLFGFPFSSGVHTWGVRVKGPVFVAIFRPTSIVIAVIMSAIFLGEAVYLGSVIGGVILTIGLYAVLWGKAKEEEMKDDGSGLSTKAPLLKSQNVEEN
ncbi:WAT1-related protein At5g40240 [Gossypium raimondii]|uniref:WAT1-related protein n=2 Tax=Gossypium raimondii TaxID=29730 RepID=A0A0D2V2B5_GOSRA|nr:WAT1-related protein At5g40240 [Gossypium raimondii]KJB75831.1 hypothetical protein B456_012G060200 [Gossypium raimondii]